MEQRRLRATHRLGAHPLMELGMKRSMLLPALVLLVAACSASDSVSAPGIVTPAITPDGAIKDLTGTIRNADGHTWLMIDAAQIALTGGLVAPLATLNGAEVEVKGTYDAANAFIVNEFAVKMVDGQPAADGTLESSGAGFGLRLSDGTLRLLINPPTALTIHVGERVWVAGPADQAPVEFGVL